MDVPPLGTVVGDADRVEFAAVTTGVAKVTFAVSLSETPSVLSAAV
jgi:hypothetical protein